MAAWILHPRFIFNQTYKKAAANGRLALLNTLLSKNITDEKSYYNLKFIKSDNKITKFFFRMTQSEN